MVVDVAVCLVAGALIWLPGLAVVVAMFGGEA